MQIIETWPELEDVLIDYVPAFQKLKNPVLRKTVARIATLQQAASVGKVKVEDLVNRLRKEVDQDMLNENENNAYNIHRPHWYSNDKIHGELDARKFLDAGEHPINQVMADLKMLPPGKIYRLTAPFLPAPLIDKASSVAVEHWIKEVSADEFEIYFYKPV